MSRIGIFVLLFSLALLFESAVPEKGLHFKEPPPGTVRLTDSIYVDIQPVRVVDYLEFLSAIRNSYSPKIRDSIKDFPQWGLEMKTYQNLLDHTPWDSLYFERMLPRTLTTYANDIQKYDVDFHIKNPQYFPYPVVNLSYRQVYEYCKWRTAMVMLHYAIKCTSEKQRRKYPMNLKYRLAKVEEWDNIISKFFGRIEKEKFETKKNEHLVTNHIAPYPQKKYFQYQSTNVGEMLEDYKVAVGFAWDGHFGIGKINYVEWEKPVDWVGFRCVCEILPEKGQPKKKKVEDDNIVRDKFGKVIYDPNSKKRKKKTAASKSDPKKEQTKSKKTITKEPKAGKKHGKAETMKKKRRKHG